MPSPTADGKCGESSGLHILIAYFEPEHLEQIPAMGKDHAGRMKVNMYTDGHGHINYADLNGNGVYDSGDCKHSWGYWVAGGYDAITGDMEAEFVDCGNKVWTDADCNGSGRQW